MPCTRYALMLGSVCLCNAAPCSCVVGGQMEARLISNIACYLSQGVDLSGVVKSTTATDTSQ
jgi:hypothetical protein